MGSSLRSQKIDYLVSGQKIRIMAKVLFLRSWTLLVVTFTIAILSAQNTPLRFERLSVEEGLSQGNVNFILKDSRGFLWFATQDGLNRYDGYECKVYSHEPGDAQRLASNYIWTLWEDPKGDLWIGTFGGGLCRWD
jgi:ligand-binding sensor domain-containing protein